LQTPPRASAAGFYFALHTFLQSVAFAALQGHDAAKCKTWGEVCMNESHASADCIAKVESLGACRRKAHFLSDLETT